MDIAVCNVARKRFLMQPCSRLCRRNGKCRPDEGLTVTIGCAVTWWCRTVATLLSKNDVKKQLKHESDGISSQDCNVLLSFQWAATHKSFRFNLVS